MFGTTSNGWIGIDVGAASVKLAQLERRRGAVEVTKLASVPRTLGDDPADSLRNDIEALLVIAGELRGKRAAAALSMNCCQLEMNAAPANADDPVSGMSVASWPVGEDAGRAETGWCSLAADADQADAAANGLLKAGLSCRTIDGAPMAVARAVGMIGADIGDVIGAIDWGWSAATFVSVVDGYPIYARVLKGCGLEQMVGLIADELGIGADEAREAFAKHPPHAPGYKPSSVEPLAAELATVVRPQFQRLRSEVLRTLSHLGSHRRRAAPSSLCVLGGGALLPGVAVWLGRESELPAQLWRPANAGEAEDLPVYAPAIALSALRWETR